jgi:alpha-ketoglutarate-dependent taurine dioxygenase
MALQITDIKPKIGSEIRVDKQELLSGAHAAQIRELLEQRGVLVFPQINFTDEEQVEFTKILGTFAREPTVDGENIYQVTLGKNDGRGVEYLKGSMYWHIDGTMNEVPILASILSAKVLSPTGGQTEFCNTYAAYEDMSDEDKALYANERVLHSAWNTLFYYEPEPALAKLQAMMAVGDKELPLVWNHRSGRKSLVLGCTAYHVLNKTPKQSAELLVKLREWATQPQFVYRHEWTVGDMVMWDNTGTMHRAIPYDPTCGRLLHRTKLEGEEAIA